MAAASASLCVDCLRAALALVGPVRGDRALERVGDEDDGEP
jgi:hypothetical protein